MIGGNLTGGVRLGIGCLITSGLRVILFVVFVFVVFIFVVFVFVLLGIFLLSTSGV